MLDQEFNISKLILGELNKTLSASEQAQLNSWVETSKANSDFYAQFTDQASLKSKFSAYRQNEENKVWIKIQAELSKSQVKTSKRLFFSKKNGIRQRIAIAAAITSFFLATGLWFWISSTRIDQKHFYSNIKPGTQGATLTLSSGKTIKLSAESNGKLAEESGVKITKSIGGEISYEITGKGQASIGYNTLSTSNGETYKLSLPDGSRIWLNAASTLIYPTSFSSAIKRQVKLMGEAYFEIAKDKTHPFIVETNSQRVEVLGTHFNISAYQDEPLTKTTLMEGSVRISNPSQSQLLKPGEQAIVNGRDIAVVPGDLEEALDWKNGKIVFNDETLSTIMKKISRWYDVEVIYREGTDKLIYQGSVSRTSKISSVLNFFRDTETVDFIIQGRQITVIRKE